jgi:hypothetical protein
MGRSSRSANHAIGTRNFPRSLITSTATFLPHSPVHLTADNYATHKHPRIKAWLTRHPRYHIHYTPTYASWLNQVERWFALITQRAIRRGSFRSVRELVHKIEQSVTHHNLHCRPFAWTASADSILDKLQRLVNLLTGHDTSGIDRERVAIDGERLRMRAALESSPNLRLSGGGREIRNAGAMRTLAPSCTSLVRWRFPFDRRGFPEWAISPKPCVDVNQVSLSYWRARPMLATSDICS